MVRKTNKAKGCLSDDPIYTVDNFYSRDKDKFVAVIRCNRSYLVDLLRNDVGWVSKIRDHNKRGCKR